MNVLAEIVLPLAPPGWRPGLTTLLWAAYIGTILYLMLRLDRQEIEELRVPQTDQFSIPIVGELPLHLRVPVFNAIRIVCIPICLLMVYCIFFNMGSDAMKLPMGEELWHGEVFIFSLATPILVNWHGVRTWFERTLVLALAYYVSTQPEFMAMIAAACSFFIYPIGLIICAIMGWLL